MTPTKVNQYKVTSTKEHPQVKELWGKLPIPGNCMHTTSQLNQNQTALLGWCCLKRAINNEQVTADSRHKKWVFLPTRSRLVCLPCTPHPVSTSTLTDLWTKGDVCVRALYGRHMPYQYTMCTNTNKTGAMEENTHQLSQAPSTSMRHVM